MGACIHCINKIRNFCSLHFPIVIKKNTKTAILCISFYRFLLLSTFSDLPIINNKNKQVSHTHAQPIFSLLFISLSFKKSLLLKRTKKSDLRRFLARIVINHETRTAFYVTFLTTGSCILLKIFASYFFVRLRTDFFF